MGFSLKLFLKQFVFLNWITKDQAVFIEENMNAPTCSLLQELDHKITCDENKIEDLKRKLAIAKEALKDWIEWEDEQIKKDGAYVRPEINELIKNGKAALKQIAD